MLNATITTYDGATYTNLLHTVVSTGGHQLPEGTTHWGLRAVFRNTVTGERYSSFGFVYPEPGNWAQAPGPIIYSNTLSCPSQRGDGLCLATTEINPSLHPYRYCLFEPPSSGTDIRMWQGIASNCTRADHLLLVAYNQSDVLGVDYFTGKVRVRRMFVVADVDGIDLITRQGSGADLKGLYLPGLDDLSIQLLMEGATYAEVSAATAAGISPRWYVKALREGASHDELLAAANEGMDLYRYAAGRSARLTHGEVCALHRLGLDLPYYLTMRSSGISHERIVIAVRNGINAFDYHLARQAGASHRRVRAADRAGIDLATYAYALRVGTRHHEILAVHRAGLDLWDYTTARAVATHREACEAAALSSFVVDYVSLRLSGQRHQQALIPVSAARDKVPA